MNKIYDTAFILGASFNFLLFIILNAVSLRTAEKEYLNSPAHIYFNSGFNWGFPFNWGEDFAMILEGGSIFNLGALLLGCVFFGFLFKIIWSGISPRDNKLV